MTSNVRFSLPTGAYPLILVETLDKEKEPLNSGHSGIISCLAKSYLFKLI